MYMTPSSLEHLQFHPSQPDTLVSPGLLGTMHFLSFPQPILTHSLTVVPRNLQFTTSTPSSQCSISAMALSETGTTIAVAI